MRTVINVVIILVGIIGLSGLADATSDDFAHQQCVRTCNTKYTASYNQCKGVSECQDYVIGQAQSCIRKCPTQ